MAATSGVPPRARTVVFVCLSLSAASHGCAGFRSRPLVDDGEAGPQEASSPVDVASNDAGPESDAANLLPQTFQVVTALPGGETFQAVYAADGTDVFVVGTNGVHDDYYSGAWNRSQPILGRDYYALWGTSASDVYTVGQVQADGTGIVQYFDGSGWRDEYFAPTALYGVWGTGATARDVVLAVGANGAIYGKAVGTTDWGLRATVPANPNVAETDGSPILWGISGISFQDFCMAGDRDRIFHWIDSLASFEWLDPSVDTTLVFRSVWQAPINRLSAFFGTNYFGVAWFASFGDYPDAALPDGAVPEDAGFDDFLYQITEDQSQPGYDQKFMRGIWGTATSVLFAGDEGRIYSYSAAIDNMQRAQSPTVRDLYGVSGTDANNVWIVGAAESILHGTLPQ
jgi:hypothetical protein